MRKDDKEKLEKLMLEKILSLKKDAVSYKKLIKPISPDSAIGRISRMEAINSKSINEEALRKVEYTLARLERAIRMIDDPDFGLCAECEEPIPVARLLIMPEADLCVACAGKAGG